MATAAGQPWQELIALPVATLQSYHLTIEVIKMKKCTKCEKEQPLSQYHNDKTKKDGKVGTCKSCKAEYRREYYKGNSDKLKAYSYSYYHENKDEVRDKAKKRYIENIEDYRKRRKAQYWAAHEDNIRKSSEYHLQRLKDDSFYRFVARCRKRVWAAFNEGGYSKKTKTFELIGCTQDEVRRYVEDQFEEGMSWDNYGEWHLDHKIPLSSAENEEEIALLCHYLNLQPLWAVENLSKSAKYCPIQKQKKIEMIRRESEYSSNRTPA